MKYSIIVSTVALLAGEAVAYPAIAEKIASGQLAPRQAGTSIPDATKRFNAKAQHVSITGEHEFRMPDLAAGDQRGPCPGLNAMANHGYLPRNGVGNDLDFITGTFKVFGMAADLSGFLTVLGSSIDGNGLVWSIGGPSKAVTTFGGLLGQAQGISGSHNKYEGDASPGRGDLYLNGDDFSLQMAQFQQLHDMAMANGDNIDLALMNEFRSMRFDHSVQNNPYFFNGPFTGVLVAPAAFEFIYRFMGNKSAEFPAGKLNTATLRTFFGVQQASDGSLSHIPGSERIPANFYKRAIGDEYSIPYLNTDTVLAATKHPKFLTIGGNLGKPNTLTGVTPAKLSGGAVNAKMLLQGNNLACFASEFATQGAPDAIKCGGIIADLTGQAKKLTAQFQKSFGSLGCPKLTAAQTDQFTKFPGYTELDCATGTYKQ